jgi:hypothetical protein
MFRITGFFVTSGDLQFLIEDDTRAVVALNLYGFSDEKQC